MELNEMIFLGACMLRDRHRGAATGPLQHRADGDEAAVLEAARIWKKVRELEEAGKL
jgi:hypothetical protein